MGCHALEHGRGTVTGAQPFREPDQPVGRHHRFFRVGTHHAAIGHGVAWSETAHSGSDRLDGAGGLLPRSERQGRDLVETRAVVDVDEVDPGGFDTNQRLPLGRDGVRHLLEPEALGTAMSMDSDGFHIRTPLSSRKGILLVPRAPSHSDRRDRLHHSKPHRMFGVFLDVNPLRGSSRSKCPWRR